MGAGTSPEAWPPELASALKLPLVQGELLLRPPTDVPISPTLLSFHTFVHSYPHAWIQGLLSGHSCFPLTGVFLGHLGPVALSWALQVGGG